MSADLLKRAAKVLRGLVADLPVRVQSDWDQDSSEIYAEPAHEWVGETLQDGGAEIAYYVVRMHPPVALALADWLEVQAEFIEEAPPHLGVGPKHHAFAVARAILREDS